MAGRDYAETEAHLGRLAADCRERLASGASALDVVEHAVTEMESSGLYVAGRGSAPNTAGYVELDASIMFGPTREAGSVASVRDVMNPVSVARAVMEQTPHVMLAGNGALEFAKQKRFALVEDPAGYYKLPVGVEAEEVDTISHGTVGAVALDVCGQLAAATSTGGTFGKLEGRVGDTPLIGAGTWADDAVAVSCTGTGEYFIRAGGALSVASRAQAGKPLTTAIDELLADVKQLGGDGGVIAVTRAGEIVMSYNSEGMKRASAGSEQPVVSETF